MRLIISLLLLISCSRHRFSHLMKTDLILDEKKVTTYIVKDRKDMELGLSHIKEDDFSDKEAMLFYDVDKISRICQFWMPNTHFDLDIFFLDEDFKVVYIHRSLEKFPYGGPLHWIPITKQVKCTHALEMKSSSPLAKRITEGMVLNWENML